MQGLSDQADLSDKTFKALDDKATRLRKLKVLLCSISTLDANSNLHYFCPVAQLPSQLPGNESKASSLAFAGVR